MTIKPDKSCELGLLERLILRGRENAKADLKGSGGAYSLDQLCSLLGDVSGQAVSKLVQDKAIFAVTDDDGNLLFPAAQFSDDGRPLSGLQTVLGALPSDNGWYILNFLVNHHHDLDGAKPLKRLQAREVDIVVMAARRTGVQGG